MEVLVLQNHHRKPWNCHSRNLRSLERLPHCLTDHLRTVPSTSLGTYVIEKDLPRPFLGVSCKRNSGQIWTDKNVRVLTGCGHSLSQNNAKERRVPEEVEEQLLPLPFSRHFTGLQNVVVKLRTDQMSSWPNMLLCVHIIALFWSLPCKER